MIQRLVKTTPNPSATKNKRGEELLPLLFCAGCVDDGLGCGSLGEAGIEDKEVADAIAEEKVLLMLLERALVPLDARDDIDVDDGTRAELVGEIVCRAIRRTPSTNTSLMNAIFSAAIVRCR
jgi:hypothetical protein